MLAKTVDYDKFDDRGLLKEILDAVLTYFEENNSLNDYLEKFGDREDFETNTETKSAYDDHVSRTNDSYARLVSVLRSINLRVHGGNGSDAANDKECNLSATH